MQKNLNLIISLKSKNDLNQKKLLGFKKKGINQ